MKLLLLLAVLGQEPASPTFLAWGLLAGFAGQDNEDHAKLLSAKADREKIASGDRITLRFEVDVDPEWHTYPTYRQKFTQETSFAFESGDVFIAGPIKNPPTKRHEEKTFAYDEIEGLAVWEVPVRIYGSPGPFAVKGKVLGQTCKGVCYDMELPFEIPITIEASDAPRVKVVSAKPAKESAKNGDPVAVELTLEVPKDWYIYPFNKARGIGKATVIEAFPGEVRGVATEPKPRAHDEKDPDLAYDYHEGTIAVTVPIAPRNTDVRTVTMRCSLVYQICGGPDKICLNGSTPFTFTIKSQGGDDLPAWTPDAQAVAKTSATDASKEAGRKELEKGLVVLLLAAFGFGLVSLVQPCVFPLLPITLTYFIKQGEGSRAKTFLLTLVYGAGLILSFTLIGLIFSVSLGPDGPRLFAANPWVNVGVGILFLWFTFSMFGLYEIALPSFITEKLTGGGPKKGFGGAFILGLLFSVVTFTCTIPFAANVLVIAAIAPGKGALVMFVYAATMALPFVLLGAVPALLKSMPKSGGWLHTVKVTMGFIELALALFYLSKSDTVWRIGVLTRPVMITCWVTLLGVTACYLLGVFRMKDEEERPALGVGRMLFAAFFAANAVFVASGFTGRPLALWETVIPPSLERSGGAEQPTFSVLKTAEEEAKKTGKPVFIEFTGYT